MGTPRSTPHVVSRGSWTAFRSLRSLHSARNDTRFRTLTDFATCHSNLQSSILAIKSSLMSFLHPASVYQLSTINYQLPALPPLSPRLRTSSRSFTLILHP